MPSTSAEHWSRIYRTKNAAELSWYQPQPRLSLQLIANTHIPADAPILDVGGGTSFLVDELLSSGYSDLTVLDLAPEALAQVRARLGPAAERITWIPADVTSFRPPRSYAVWHDRAVLHFFLDPLEQEKYVRSLRSALRPGSWVVLATFGPHGPTRCSGLPVRRYSAEMLAGLLGSGFQLRDSVVEDHLTPFGVPQQFLYTSWKEVA